MGNTNNSGRNQKKDYSSLLGTEVWTNLNKKWSNVPGAVIDFDSFFRIIKYSYEGIPKSLCSCLFYLFVSDLNDQISIKHFLATLAAVFDPDPKVFMKYLFRVYDVKHQGGELSIIYIDKLLRIAYDNIIPKEQISAFVQGLFLVPIDNTKLDGKGNSNERNEPRASIGKTVLSYDDFLLYQGDTSLLYTWVKAVLFTCFIESYYPDKLYALDKKYATTCEVKEFNSHFGDLSNHLQLCYCIRSLYYSKCTPSSVKCYYRKSELSYANWLYWIREGQQINTILATTIYNLYLNGIKATWRFSDFAEFTMMFYGSPFKVVEQFEANRRNVIEGTSDVALNGSTLQQCFSVESRVSYICAAFHFRFCAPLFKLIEDDPQSQTDTTHANPSDISIAISVIVKRFLLEHNDRICRNSGSDASENTVPFHRYNSEELKKDNIVDNLAHETIQVIIKKYFMRKMILVLFLSPTSCDSACSGVRRHSTGIGGSGFQSQLDTPNTDMTDSVSENLDETIDSMTGILDDFNCATIDNSVGVREAGDTSAGFYNDYPSSILSINLAVAGELKSIASAFRKQTDNGSDGRPDDIITLHSLVSERDMSMQTCFETALHGNDDCIAAGVACAMGGAPISVKLPAEVENALYRLECYCKHPSLSDYENILVEHYDLVPQFRALSMLVHCDMGLVPSTRQLEKQYITELILKYQVDRGVCKTTPWGRCGTEWCMVPKSWWDQWQMYVGQICSLNSGSLGKHQNSIQRPSNLTHIDMHTAAYKYNEHDREILRSPIVYLDALHFSDASRGGKASFPLLQAGLNAGGQIELVSPAVYKALSMWYSADYGGNVVRGKETGKMKMEQISAVSYTDDVGTSIGMRCKVIEMNVHSKQLSQFCAEFNNSADSVVKSECMESENLLEKSKEDPSGLGIEIFPIIIKLYRCNSQDGSFASQGTGAIEVMCSRETCMREIMDYAKTVYSPSINATPTSTRLWFCGASTVVTSQDASIYGGSSGRFGAGSYTQTLPLNHQYVVCTFNVKGDDKPEEIIAPHTPDSMTASSVLLMDSNLDSRLDSWIPSSLLYPRSGIKISDARESPNRGNMLASQKEYVYISLLFEQLNVVDGFNFWPRDIYRNAQKEEEEKQQKGSSSSSLLTSISNGVDYEGLSSTATNIMSNMIDSAASMLSSKEDLVGLQKECEVATPRFVINPDSYLIGLNNLGNTCYMNSSLQILLHTPPLADYFLSQVYFHHLAMNVKIKGIESIDENISSNDGDCKDVSPVKDAQYVKSSEATVVKDSGSEDEVGYEGKLASLYNRLVQEMWLTTESLCANSCTKDTKHRGKNRSLNPKAFRRELMQLVQMKKGSWASEQFRLGEQHDAQEFLHFILDSLGEDLSWTVVKKSSERNSLDRVKDESDDAPVGETENPVSITKPKNGYIEQPDSNDAEYAVYKDPITKEGNVVMDKVLADVWWSNHFQKEISVIQTLFMGQYKSKTYCQVCNYNSCRYETFNSLSLPIPKLNAQGVPSSSSDGTRGMLLHVVPLYDHQVVRCFVNLPVTDTIDDVILALLDLQVPNLSKNSMFQVAECIKNRVFALYLPSKLISKIKPHACLYVFELARRYTPVIEAEKLGVVELDDVDVPASACKNTPCTETVRCGKLSYKNMKASSSIDSLLDNGDDGSVSGLSGLSDGSSSPCRGSPIPFPIDESLVRVVFTHRRVKLVSIYDNIEKYVIEAFGTPIMLRLPPKLASKELYQIILKIVRPFIKDRVPSADSDGNDLENPSRSVSNVSRSSGTVGASGPFGLTASSYYAFSSSRKRFLRGHLASEKYEKGIPSRTEVDGRFSETRMESTPPSVVSGAAQEVLLMHHLTQVRDTITGGMENFVPAEASVSKKLQITSVLPLPVEDVYAGSLDEFGFKLRFIDVASDACSRCGWLAKCDGCCVDPSSNESVEFRDGETMAIDWHLAVFEELLELGKMRGMKNHPSMRLKQHADGKLRQEKKRVKAEGISLYKCFDQEFMEEEHIEDLKCPCCNKDGRMQKRFQLYRLPPILIIQLKRFQFDYSMPGAGGGTKIMTHIDYPVNNLDVSQYMTSTMSKPGRTRPSDGESECVDADEERVKTHYQLYGVVYHIGILGGGHYMASARDLSDGMNGIGFQDGKDENETPNYASGHFQNKYKHGIKLGEFVSEHVTESEDKLEASGITIDNDTASTRCSAGRSDTVPSEPLKSKATKWYLYNDDEVKELSSSDIVSPAAYLLFYMREDVINADIISIMNRHDIKSYIAQQFQSNIVTNDHRTKQFVSACAEQYATRVNISGSTGNTDLKVAGNVQNHAKLGRNGPKAQETASGTAIDSESETETKSDSKARVEDSNALKSKGLHARETGYSEFQGMKHNHAGNSGDQCIVT